MSEFNYNTEREGDIDFGDYVTIEQKRYGAENEFYLHKVIGRLRSNSYVVVPVDGGKTAREEILHDEMEDVIRAVCCGVDETEVKKYRIKDVIIESTGKEEAE